MLNDLSKKVLLIKNNPESIKQFLEENIGFIYGAIYKVFGSKKKFKARCRNSSYTEEDLFNEAIIITLKCIKKYDSEKGNFLTYLYLYMNELKKVLRDKEHIIRLPRNFYNAYNTYRKMSYKGDESELSKDILEKAEIYSKGFKSLNYSYKNSEGELTSFESFIEDKINAYEKFEDLEYAKYLFDYGVRKIYESSNPKTRDKNVDILKRFFIDGMSYKEIANFYGNTNMTISKIITKFRKFILESEIISA